MDEIMDELFREQIKQHILPLVSLLRYLPLSAYDGCSSSLAAS